MRFHKTYGWSRYGCGLVALLMGLLLLTGPVQARQAGEDGFRAERIFVHTAKSFYMPGELIWFRLFMQDPATGGVADWSHVAYVELLNPAGEPVLRAKVDMRPEQSRSGSFYVTPALASGSYTLVAYTALMKAVGPESFFKQEIQVLNPFLPAAVDSVRERRVALLSASDRSGASARDGGSFQIGVTSPTGGFGKREKVDLQVQTLLDGRSAPADLSISIYKVDAFYDLAADSRRLESSTASGSASQVMRSSLPESVLPEQRYHHMHFKLTNKTNDAPLMGQDVLLAVPGPNHKLYTARTDDRGVVSFYVKDLFGNRQVAIRLVDGRESHVELLSPFHSWTDAELPREEVEPRLFDGAMRESILEHSLNIQAENSFFARERAQMREALVDTLPFYGSATVIYRLDDYTRFVLMEEVLREYIPEVRLQRRAGNYQFRVVNEMLGHYFENSPLVMVDGVPISHENDVVAFDPLKIEKISIVTRRYFIGEMVFDGMINFSTYEGVLEDFPLESAVTLIPYEALQPDRQFFSPQHDGTDERIAQMPDTRQQLYWNPSLSVDESGSGGFSFYTSDVSGEYEVVIHGRSPDGEMGSTRTRFIVTNRKE